MSVKWVNVEKNQSLFFVSVTIWVVTIMSEDTIHIDFFKFQVSPVFEYVPIARCSKQEKK